jgi:thymidylate synthase (FAD)
MRDPLCKSVVLSATHKPQQLIWLAAHQDYSAFPVFLENIPHRDERHYGERVIQMLLAGGKGHFGCLEHPQITLNCCFYPHSVVMQARTHRIGISFDVQSFRYTSESVLKIETDEDLEKAFYFRPVGFYQDRFGKTYEYTQQQRERDLLATAIAVERYSDKIGEGVSEEHARDCLPSNYRQHFVVSFNARSLFHFLDLRGKADAQLEIQWLAEDILKCAQYWMPEVTQWYIDKRWRKAKLAP